MTGNTEEQTEQKQKHLKSLVMRASNEMMEKLIGGGAEINCIREDGLTPLMLALSKVTSIFFRCLENWVNAREKGRNRERERGGGEVDDGA